MNAESHIALLVRNLEGMVLALRLKVPNVINRFDGECDSCNLKLSLHRTSPKYAHGIQSEISTSEREAATSCLPFPRPVQSNEALTHSGSACRFHDATHHWTQPTASRQYSHLQMESPAQPLSLIPASQCKRTQLGVADSRSRRTSCRINFQVVNVAVCAQRQLSQGQPDLPDLWFRVGLFRRYFVCHDLLLLHMMALHTSARFLST